MNKLIEIITSILNKRFRGSLTIHFDGKGGFIPDLNLIVKNDEVIKLLTDKKE